MYLVPYEVYNLNFYSLFSFIIPILYSYYYNLLFLTFGSLTCLCIGLKYHSCYDPFYEYIDKMVVRVCVIGYNLVYMTWTIYYLGTLICTVLLILGYNYLSLSSYGVLFHSLLHFISILGICLMIKGYSLK